MSWLELIAAGLGIVAVWLTVRQNPWCWPIGLIMVLLYAWLFYDWRLYSNLLLQLLFAALQLYGWWQWTRGGERHDGRKVSRLGVVAVLTGLLIGALGGLLVGITSVGSGSVIMIALLMLYPGRYDGLSLRLFSKLTDDNYYRAFSLVS